MLKMFSPKSKKVLIKPII